MKQALILFFTVATMNICIAQAKYGNWVVEDGNVVFEKIYESDSAGLKSRVINHLKNIGGIKNLSLDGQTIYCDLLDYLQVNQNPMMAASQNWRGRIVIEIKGNRYRVRALGLTEAVKSATFQGTIEIESTINDVLLKKNKPEFKTGSQPLDFADRFGKEMEDLFLLKPSKKSDW